MRHALDGETLIVSGLVRNPTTTATPALSAVVSVLGRDGQIVAAANHRSIRRMLDRQGNQLQGLRAGSRRPGPLSSRFHERQPDRASRRPSQRSVANGSGE